MTSTFVDVYAMDVHDGYLYVAGQFGAANGIPANGIARWDGTSWSALGSGTSHSSNPHYAWTVHGDASGLYIGGTFSSVSGVSADNIARWDGHVWHPVGNNSQTLGIVRAITVYNGQVVAGTSYGLWHLVGGTWQVLGRGVNGSVSSLLVHNGQLIVGGGFTMAGGPYWEGGVPVKSVARWNGSAWFPMGQEITGTVRTLLRAGDAIYAGGSFGVAPGILNVARWNGTRWLGVGQGLGLTGMTNCNCVRDLEIYQGHLIASGDFSGSPAGPIASIAIFDGAEWTALGGGTAGNVFSVASYRGGLVAGGRFGMIGGVAARHVATWNGVPPRILYSNFE